jgi:protein-tyrosine-phosphatase
MAEGFLRALAGDRCQPFSAGTEAATVSPLATEVMCEVGIDISTQKPRDVASLFHDTFHYVVVLSEPPRERYPVYPFTRNLLKWSVANPEMATGGPDAETQAFRQVRDQMRGMVEGLIQTMNRHATFANVRAAAA